MKKQVFFPVIIMGVVLFSVYGCGQKKTAHDATHGSAPSATHQMTTQDDNMGTTGQTMQMGESAAKEMVAQKTCPVMGNPITKDLFVDYKGHRIYVCCGGCISAVKEDPEKYIKKLADMGEKPESL